MLELSLIQKIAISIIPVLFAITVHEVAHGWVANKLGDPTARLLGRLTLNPIKHIDPIGTILVPGILLLLGGFIFGWAKPVPITWQNLKHKRRDVALVSLAGPLSNLVMAIFWAILFKIALNFNPQPINYAFAILVMSQIGVVINIILMVLNLIPIPPLDGSRVVSSFLPGRIAYQYDKLEPYGFIILIVLLATGMLSLIMSPVVNRLVQALI
ncbi:MAG TPA: site-2 protease family protein [Gammaproteobacteria bacterium]|nr:site-2 protease family protein [Gammaproteobacteria bacterium]